MKAIVTGGCGFIGFNLVQTLLDAKWEVLVIDNFSSGKKWNTWTSASYAEAAVEGPWFDSYIVGEKPPTTTKTAIDYLVKEFYPDVIFHLAAIPRVTYSVEQPIETTSVNVGGTLAVLDAARNYGKKNIKVVFSSSSSIYGDTNVHPTPVESPSNPQSPYAMQKWQCEEWCRMYAKLYGLDVVCLRYFNVTGPHSYYGGAYSTVLSGWLYTLHIVPGIRPFLEGDGKQSRDFCDIDNVVQANILAACPDLNFHGEAFNVAQGEAHSLLDCKDLLEKITDRVLDLEMRPERVGDVKHTLADISLTKEKIGYDPEVDFEKQVTKMSEWYAKHYPRSK